MVEAIENSVQKTVGSICANWWGEIQKKPGPRARLRRAGSILELLLEPETHRLKLLLSKDFIFHADRIAVTAGVLANIDSSTSSSFAKSLGELAKDKSAIEPRLQKLLRLEWNENEELLSQTRRILPLINKMANIESISENLLKWSDPVKKRIAVEFYEVKSTGKSDK